jgi:hypothetical protein
MIISCQYMCASSFRDTAQQAVDLCPLWILSVWTQKPRCIQQQLKMERHFANAFFMPVKRSATRDLWKGATVHNQTCTHVHWFTRRAFWAFIVNCNFMNDNNWTVTNLRTYIIVERNFLTKLIKNSFPYKCLYIFLAGYVELLLEVCPVVLNTPCITKSQLVSEQFVSILPAIQW